MAKGGQGEKVGKVIHDLFKLSAIDTSTQNGKWAGKGESRKSRLETHPASYRIGIGKFRFCDRVRGG